MHRQNDGCNFCDVPKRTTHFGVTYVLLQPFFDSIRKIPSQSITLSAESHLVLIKGHAFDISISALYLTQVSVEEMAYVGPTLSESSMSKAFKVAQS